MKTGEGGEEPGAGIREKRIVIVFIGLTLLAAYLIGNMQLLLIAVPVAATLGLDQLTKADTDEDKNTPPEFVEIGKCGKMIKKAPKPYLLSLA